MRHVTRVTVLEPEQGNEETIKKWEYEINNATGTNNEIDDRIIKTRDRSKQLHLLIG